MCLNTLLNRNFLEAVVRYLAFVQGTRHRSAYPSAARADLHRKRAAGLSRRLCACACVPYAHTFIMDDIQMLLTLPEQIVMVRLTSH